MRAIVRCAARALVFGAFAAAPTAALTRLEVLQESNPYITTSITIETRHVYPAFTHCYSANSGDYGPTLQPGSYAGLPYSYGNKFTPGTTSAHLASASTRGAGNHKALYNQDSNCVHGWITGIDCSGFVARSWKMSGVNDLYVGALTAGTVSQVISYSQLQPGDVIATSGHIVLFYAWLQPPPGQIWLRQASPTQGRTHEFLDTQQNRQAAGYIPFVKNDLRDTPLAAVVYFKMGTSTGPARMQWKTKSERDTRSFVVCRARDRTGPFLPVSGEIIAQGSTRGGGLYEFVDNGSVESEPFYRLLEYEVSGRALWHGIASTQEWNARAGDRSDPDREGQERVR